MPFANGAGGPADGGSYVYPWYFQNADLLDRGPSDFDIRHRFVTSYVWQLPRLARIERGWFAASSGDWQFTGVLQCKRVCR